MCCIAFLWSMCPRAPGHSVDQQQPNNLDLGLVLYPVVQWRTRFEHWKVCQTRHLRPSEGLSYLPRRTWRCVKCRAKEQPESSAHHLVPAIVLLHAGGRVEAAVRGGGGAEQRATCRAKLYPGLQTQRHFLVVISHFFTAFSCLTGNGAGSAVRGRCGAGRCIRCPAKHSLKLQYTMHV